MFYSVLVSALLTAGCTTKTLQPSAPAAPLASVEVAVAEFTAARAAQDSKVLASVEQIEQHAEQPPVVRAEAGVIRATLGPAEVTPADRLAATERALALAEGRAEEARRLYSEANAAATQAAAAISAAEARAAAAIAAAEKAIADASAQNAKILAAANARADRAEAEARNVALREQARYLTWAGLGFFGAFAISLFAGGGIAGALKTWPLLLLGAGCFGLAQVISHPWFLRAFVGLLVVGGGYTVWWVYDRHKQGRLRAALAKREAMLKQVLPVLDEAYENAGDTVKQVLDANVFDRLSNLFDRTEKAEVHALRAELKAQSPQP